MEADKEDHSHINILPEELSNLLEYFPTILPEWNDIDRDTSRIVASSDWLETDCTSTR